MVASLRSARSMVGLTALGPQVAARVLLMLAAGVLTACSYAPGQCPLTLTGAVNLSPRPVRLRAVPRAAPGRPPSPGGVRLRLGYRNVPLVLLLGAGWGVAAGHGGDRRGARGTGRRARRAAGAWRPYGG
ncbi:hypothetical protein TPA0910_37470 [Streptomyces hygroscopicus subsp. sporocinereus]|uniref:Lipoprotein n=1 Tax=Streptomyces hygroscopicus TaxID=1912 RepID=A0ABQ3U119_STRHY|nr:hypothetical protein [Streptomyces hygroscopicus]GHJ29314.1 hypothetical protein TPA0910_37470 [Streptomyces hygroscopicus]